MNNPFRLLPAFLLMLIFLLPQLALCKSFTIPVIRVEVAVQPNGDIRITEYRTYVFDGTFSWADYRLPFKGFKAIKNIRISENGKNFINQNSEDPGTFQVQKDDGQIRMKWFYDARDEKRTFKISYTLEGAVVTGPEWAEFFWNYLSADREKDTDSLNITMHLPHKISPDSLFVWKRGPQAHINLQKVTDGYSVHATNIDDDEFVKIRSVFPKNMFNQGVRSTSNADFSLNQAQKNEKQYQEQRKIQLIRDRKYAGYGRELAIIICVFSIAGFIFFYQKYGKRHAVNITSPDETMLIPVRLEPAVAGWLLSGRNIGSTHLMATLLDLARRKYFIIKEQKPEQKRWGKDKKIFTIEKTTNTSRQKLNKMEAKLAEFISEQIDEENQQLDKLFAESSHSARTWFSSWKKELKTYGKAKNWYDQTSYTGVYTNLTVQLLLVAFGGLATYWAGPVGIIPMMIAFFLFLGSFAIIRRTPEGERMYAQWKAYKEGLKNAENYTFSSDLLGKHFIYAVAFGLSKKDIETVFNQCDHADVAFYWFVFYPGSSHSPASIAGTFSTLSATGAAAFPGAAGGAGASAGVAGGGAAGGAG